jgi:hypothetical protein
VDEEIGLVEFLRDLRADLQAARRQAVDEAVSSVTSGANLLWLELGEVEVRLEVAHARTVSGEVSAEVAGNFLVLASAKAAAKAAGSQSQTGTQTLTLTLKPRLDSIVIGPDGQVTTTSTGFDVDGRLDSAEQLPPEPDPPSGRA